MIHGNPQKNAGMWGSRACELESNGFICQKEQGVLIAEVFRTTTSTTGEV